MFEVSALILILQLGFDGVLSYRDHNPLNPSSSLSNYGQSRRLVHSDRYVQHYSRRTPESDSDQDSDDSSVEEGYSFRKSLQNQQNSKHNNYLRYDSKPKNDVSLEVGPIGTVSPNTKTKDFYQIYLSQLARSSSNNKQPPVQRLQPSSLRQVNNQNYRKNEDNDASLEVKPLSYNYHAQNARGVQNSNYLRSLLFLDPQLKPLRSPHNHRRVGDDSSFETQSDTNHLFSNNRPTLRASGLENTSLLIPLLLSFASLPDNRRVNLNLGRSLSNSANLKNTNRNNLRKLQPNKRNNRKHSKISENSLRNRPLFIDDDLDNNPPGLDNLNINNNRRTYTSSNLELNDESSSRKDALNDLSILSKLQTSLRRLLLTNEDPKSNESYRKNSGNINEYSSYDNLNSEEIVIDNPALRSNVDSNIESPLLKRLQQSNNQRNYNDDDMSYGLASVEKLNLNDDVSDLSVLRRIGQDDLNVYSSQQISSDQSSNNNRRNNNDASLRSSSNKPLNLDDDSSELHVKGLYDVPSELKTSARSNQPHNRRDYEDATLDHPLNDKASAEEDTIENLLILRSISLNDLLKSNARSYNNRNKNLRSNRRNTKKNIGGLELVLTDKVNPNDKNIDKLVPYQPGIETIKNKPINNTEQNKNIGRDNDLNRESSMDNNNQNQYIASLRNLVAINQLFLKNSRRDNIDQNLDDTDKFKPENSNLDSLTLELLGLRSANDDKDTKNETDVLHLEFPWNDQLVPDEGTDSSATRSRTNNNKDETDVLHLEFPWNDQLAPDEGTGDQTMRSRPDTNKDKDETDVLHLEFPWNDQLAPNSVTNNTSTDETRTRSRPVNNEDDETDVLHLEFPWNDQLAPDDGTSNSARSGPDRNKDNNYDSYILNLDYPWNGETKPNGNSTSSKSAQRSRNRNNNSGRSNLRVSNQNYRNQRRNNLDVLPLNYDSQLNLDSTLDREEANNDEYLKDSLEDPSNYITFPLDRRPSARYRIHDDNEYGSLNIFRRTGPLATTTGNPDNIYTNLRSRDTYNDTIIFPKD